MSCVVTRELNSCNKYPCVGCFFSDDKGKGLARTAHKRQDEAHWPPNDAGSSLQKAST